MRKDDMSVSAGPGQLGAVRRPGQAEHAACVRFLQRVGPLQTDKEVGETLISKIVDNEP